MSRNRPRYKSYNSPAGGWGAAAATAKVLMEQSVVGKGSRALLAMNQPGGFKCPSCAFPDATCTKKLEFCENGAKALAHETTKFRVTREFFAAHSVTELMEQSDYWLEMQVRQTEPMRPHDQFNTTIYSYNDRYRGVYGDRMILFMNADDIADRGLAAGSCVALQTIGTDGIARRVEGLTIIDYPMSRGSVAGYYPELNPLLPLAFYDKISGCPAAKSIPVRVVASDDAA